MNSAVSSRLAAALVGLLVVGAGIVGFAAIATPVSAAGPAGMAGSGTSADPYVVTNVTQLQAVGQDLDAHYELDSDIDASATSTWNDDGSGPKGFEPIGNSSTPFTGRFNGSGHAVSGLYIDRSGTNHVGLFGDVGRGGTVTRVGVEDVDVTGGKFVGGLAGSKEGKVVRSYATGDVTGTEGVGGLVGNNGINADPLATSYAVVTVSGTDNVGGLVGYTGGVVDRSYAAGEVSGSTDVGGLIGYRYSTTAVTDSYWDTEASGQGTSDGDATGLTTSQVTGAAAVSNMTGFDFATNWTARTDYPALRSARAVTFEGEGTASNPFNVTTLDELQAVRTALDANYVLDADVDAAATTGWNGGDGFEPIGDSNDEFDGTFDGSGHTISDVHIDRSGTDYVGLFGYVGSAGSVTNVSLVGGTVTGGDYVGGLAGYNDGGAIDNASAASAVSGDNVVGGLVGENHDGTIDDSDATGDVDGDGTSTAGGLVGSNSFGGTIRDSGATGDVTAGGKAGGLIGSNYRGTIERSDATGNVTGSFSVGGLIGQQNKGTIERSYASGDVEGTSNNVGGLVGYQMDGTVRRTYATGDVAGNANVGGLIGRSDGTVDRSYAAGGVSGSMQVGGLVGFQGRGTITNTYWDVQTSNQTDSDGGTGLLTRNLTGPAAGNNLNGFDFSTEWQTVADSPGKDGYAVSYPVLRNNTQSPAPNTTLYAGGDGSAGSPYEIETWNHLGHVGENLDDEFALAADLDSTVEGYDVVGSETADSGDGFAPIGNDTAAFDGTFNGSGHTVSDLHIDRGSTDDVGLFGVVGPNGVVERVGVANASVTGRDAVGGLVGTNDGNVSETYATGDVTGASEVGGLVGANAGTGGSANLSDSYATGDVTGASEVGGLVGANDGTVGATYATGAVSGTTNVSGLVGASTGGWVNDSYWDRGTTNGDGAIGNDSGTANDLRGFGATGDTAPAPEMRRFAPAVNMDALFNDSETWVLTSGYPALAWEGIAELTVDAVDAADVTVRPGASGSVTVTANESGTDAGEGVTINVTDADGLADLAGDTAVTDESGEVTFSFSTDTVGEYEPTFAWDANASVADNATVTIRRPNTGGGGGGGGTPIDDGPRISVRPIPADGGDDAPTSGSGRRVAIENAAPNVRLSIDLGDDTLSGGTVDGAADGTADGTTDGSETDTSGGGTDGSSGDAGTDGAVVMDRIALTTQREGTYEMTVETRASAIRAVDAGRADGSSDSMPDLSTGSLDEAERDFLDATGRRAAGFVRITHAFPNSDVSDVSVQFRVRKSYLAAAGVAPEAVALHRDEPTGWNRLPTRVVGESDAYYRFEADSPGLSLFTIGADGPVFETSTAAETGDAAVRVGDDAAVDVTVSNVGSADGQFVGVLTANGDALDRRTVTIPAGERRTVRLRGALSTAGRVELRLNGRSVRTITVRAAPAAETDVATATDAPPEPEGGIVWSVFLLGVGLLSGLAAFVVRHRRQQ